MSDVDRAALLAEHDAVDSEYNAIKSLIKQTATLAQQTQNFDELSAQHRRLAKLKSRLVTIRRKLSRSKNVARAKQYRREEIFIDLARKRLGEDAYREIWAEVDRVERKQWNKLWNES